MRRCFILAQFNLNSKLYSSVTAFEGEGMADTPLPLSFLHPGTLSNAKLVKAVFS